MQVCRQWAGGAADGLRGHRCGAGAGAGLLLAGGAGGRGDLLRWWCAGVVIVRAARSSSGPRGHRPGRAVIGPGRSAAGGRAGRWAKEKGQGRRRGVRCCSGLWSALAAMVPAGCVPVPVVGLICWRCRWAWSALAPFPLAAFQRHGWRWRCSIRVNFAVCRRGQILHLTGVRSRCRALT